MKKNFKKRRHSRGQTLTEYVLIIAVVVVASIGVLAAFSDTVQEKISGVIGALGGEEPEPTDSLEVLAAPGDHGVAGGD